MKNDWKILKAIIKAFFSRLLCHCTKHKLVLVERSLNLSKRRCVRCGSMFATIDYAPECLPWDEEFEDLLKENKKFEKMLEDRLLEIVKSPTHE
jgi:hypothetical protein